MSAGEMGVMKSAVGVRYDGCGTVVEVNLSMLEATTVSKLVLMLEVTMVLNACVEATLEEM